MDNAADDLQDRFNVHSIEEAEQLQAEHETFKAESLQEASTNYEELNSFVTQMAEMGSTENPYSTLTPTVCILTPRYIEWVLLLPVVMATLRWNLL